MVKRSGRDPTTVELMTYFDPAASAYVQDPVSNANRVLVRQPATGFEQGIAGIAGLLTAGPLGALASWATIRGTQGKWTPWFVLGSVAAPVLLVGQLAVVGLAVDSFQKNAPSESPVPLSPQASPRPAPNEIANLPTPSTPPAPAQKPLSNPVQQPLSNPVPPQSNSSHIPSGHAAVLSARTGQETIYGVKVSSRQNKNGHVVYDAHWSDGAHTTFVFWGANKVEIITKNNRNKSVDNTPGTFSPYKGGVMIVANTGTRTIFPDLFPITN